MSSPLTNNFKNRQGKLQYVLIKDLTIYLLLHPTSLISPLNLRGNKLKTW